MRQKMRSRGIASSTRKLKPRSKRSWTKTSNRTTQIVRRARTGFVELEPVGARQNLAEDWSSSRAEAVFRCPVGLPISSLSRGQSQLSIHKVLPFAVRQFRSPFAERLLRLRAPVNRAQANRLPATDKVPGGRSQSLLRRRFPTP